VIAKTLKDGPKDELASPRDVQGSRQRRLTSLQDAQRLLGERYMLPGRCHVFASFTSLNLHGDAKDVERRTGRFPDVYSVTTVPSALATKYIVFLHLHSRVLREVLPQDQYDIVKNLKHL